MNDKEFVIYNSTRWEMLMRTIHSSSLFRMMIESINYEDGGLFLTGKIPLIQNKNILKILFYCSNGSWPKSIIDFLYNSVTSLEDNNTNAISDDSSIDAEKATMILEDPSSESETETFTTTSKRKLHSDLFVTGIHTKMRRVFEDGLNRFCPYFRGVATPFEILMLVYVSYMKKNLIMMI